MKKKVTLIIVSVLISIIMIIAISYAFFAGTGIVNTNLGYNITFEDNSIVKAYSKENGYDNIVTNFNISSIEMFQDSTNKVVAEKTDTFVIEFNNIYEAAYKCEFDYVWKWDSNSDNYTISSSGINEFTVSGPFVEANVPNGNINSYTIGSDSIIANAGLTNTKEVPIVTKFYNLKDIDQSSHAGKHYQGSIIIDNITCEEYVVLFDHEDFAFTGTVPEPWLVPVTGQYKLEVWGAQGGGSQVDGNSSLGVGGKGGYSYGTVSLNKNDTLYIYVGGQGETSGTNNNTKAEGGFNGGGSAWGSSSGDPAGGGGGATDIRINTDSLYARVIVAGGGGGGGEDSEIGGYGGGTTGGSSGSGTAGSASGPTGYFGIGGHTDYDGGGGGGGWYGAQPSHGATTPYTANSSSDTSGSPGGSGYVYTLSTASNYPSGCLLNASYYMTDAATVAGNVANTIPTTDGTGYETGHAGNGYARITLIS